MEDQAPRLGYVVNNHGGRFCPLRIGLWDPFQMVFSWLFCLPSHLFLKIPCLKLTLENKPFSSSKPLEFSGAFALSFKEGSRGPWKFAIFVPQEKKAES